jgi:type III pantothenate kinase
MLLTIDMGNTNTGFALFDEEGGVIQSWRCKSDSRRTADEYASWLYPLFDANDLSFKNIEAIVMASVVPDADFNLEKLCRHYFNIEPIMVSSDLVQKIGLSISPEAGADRIANVIAMREKYGYPCVLIDFGTATNFDVIDASGQFIGGVLAPGINLSLHALYQAAAKLPKVDIQKPPHVIGRNTIDSMRSGVYWGYVSLINGILKGCKNELGHKDIKVVATGGLAPLFAEEIDAIDDVDQNITTYGLYLLHKALKD